MTSAALILLLPAARMPGEIPSGLSIRSRFREILVRATDCRTGKHLAQSVGVSPATVRSWRQGRALPIDEATIALLAACEELHAEVESLIRARKAATRK